MAKQLNVDLRFNADVSQAVTNLKNLQQSLTAISATPVPIGGKISSELQTAINSAKELQFHLSNAFNINTGNLNLNKLNSSLKASGQSLSTLSSGLLGAGMKGEQAFIDIQRAVTTANVQISQASTLMGNFLTTLKNTARWQLSSTLLHGFMSAMTSTISYAQDLDESLNNIRIVTQQSSEEMAKFAENANKSAKALSAATTEYTNAALIYYQQGLNNEEVIKRTDVTIKMANASRQSAEEVSDQLTSIWNNFYNGTQSLEYYADVITALGAATASSSEEIAQGLEKFAAVADTVGLSYEYATAALATVTATTRQSADVVGTAFKTLFARIQDLDLGKTLDDGTTLGQYSEALYSVGINIKDASGGLKDMNIILDEMGAKWQSLDKDQQVALAKSVAGVRQYTQLIALMDNWDFMQKNIATAENATGTLQEQADIYAESWEAANERVKASTERIINNLFPTEAVTDFTSGFAEVLDVIASIIEGLGGFETILLMISSLALTKLGPSIAVGIDQGLVKMKEFGISSMQIIPNIGNSLKNIGTQFINNIRGGQELNNILAESDTSYIRMNKTLTNIVDNTGRVRAQTNIYKNDLQSSNQILNESQLSISKAVDGTYRLTDTFQTYLGDISQVNNIQALIAKNSHLLTGAIKEQLNSLQNQLLSVAERKAEEANTLELLQEQRRNLIEMSNNRVNTQINFNPETNQHIMQMGQLSENIRNTWGNILVEANGMGQIILDSNGNLSVQANSAEDVRVAISGAAEVYSDTRLILSDIESIYSDTTLTAQEQAKQARNLINTKVKDKTISTELANTLKQSLDITTNHAPAADRVRAAMSRVRSETQQVMTSLGYSNNQILNLNNNTDQVSHSTQRLAGFAQEYKNILEQTSKTLQNGLQSALSWGGALQSFASGASKVAMGLNSILNFIDQLKSGDVDFTTVLVSGTMALSMGLSGLMTLLGGLNTLIDTHNVKKTLMNTLTQNDSAETIKNILIKKGGMAADVAAAKAQDILTVAKGKGTAAMVKATMAALGFNAALGPLMWILTAIIAIAGAFFLLWKSESAKTPEARLAAMQEQAKKSADAFKELSNQTDELFEKLDNLKNIYDNIKQLTVGTSEWYQEVAKVNYEVTKLLEQFPNLAQFLYTDENGVLQIAEQGYEYIRQEQNKLLQVANNIQLNDQKKVKQQEIEVDKNNSDTEMAYNADKIWTAATAMYNNDAIGENLFTDWGAEALTDILYGSKDDLRKIYSNQSDKYIDQLYQSNVDSVKSLLESDIDLIKKSAQNQKEIAAIDQAQLTSKAQSIGSNRSYSELQNVLGNQDYQDILSTSKSKISDKFGNWNDSINYKQGDKEWEDIQQFMKIKGASDYVAQRNGEMVLKIGDKEESFSKDEVYDALAEFESSGELENQLATGIRTSLSTALENIDLSNVESSDLIDLDNFNLQMQDIFGEESGNDFTASVLTSLKDSVEGIEDYGDAIEYLGERTSAIDWSSTDNIRTMNEAALDLKSGAISLEEFTNIVKELNTQGELDNMSGFFSSKASQMGLDEKAAKEMQEYAKHLANISEESDILSEELGQNAEGAADLAVEVTRMNKGVDTLAENIDEWGSVLKKSSKESAEYSKAMSSMKKAISDIIDVEEDMLSNDFIEKNMADIEKAAKGDAAAIDRLRASMDEEIILKVSQGKTDEVISQIDTLNTKVQDIANNLPDIEVGAVLQDEEFLAAANELVNTAGMTADEANAYFAGIGYEPVYNQADVDMSSEVPNSKTLTEVTDIGWSEADVNLGLFGDHKIKLPNVTTKTTSIPEEPSIAEGSLPLISFSGDGKPPEIKGLRKKAKGSMNNYSGSNSGGKKSGGGSKPKTTGEARQKKSDTVERYKEINDQLAKTQRLMDKNSTLADTLWGPDKIEKIQENIDALETYNEQLEQKIQLQKQYLAEDKTELINTASAVGLNFQFGEDGTVLNYTTEMTKLHNQREALLDSFGNTIDENEQKKLDEFDKKIEAVTDAYETYEETLNEGFELDQEKLDKQIEQMQLRFEKLELKIEVQVELNENDIADIEHKLERLGDNNIYSAAERIVLIQQNASSYKNIANAQINGIKEAEELYSARKITQSDYMARLQEGKEALQEAEMSIRDGIAQIGDELENTFDLVDEKLDQQFIKFDQMIELMEHYKNVISLTQGEASYKEFNEILKASQKVLHDRIAAGESEVAMWEARREDLEAQIATLPEGEAKREAEEALQAIMEKEADAKSQLMADIEQLGEYAREIFENSIEQAIIDFEDSMFGRPLNSIIESIEMMNARQEELLTTTNKIYETDKLIRNIEKDIESTSNTRAKQALVEFQNKAKQKQEQNELTKFELDLLNAEYEITKAQIALEEAQNAKDIVRLTRDSEGNFGYVYTANEDKVADAEQALDDATNNYYNTAMEGAQKYQDQIYQHIQEWEEKVKEVYLDQTLSEEEKNAKIKEINDTYNALITQDKELYYMAVGAMQESSYNNQVDYDLKGIESAENWYDNCENFLKDLEDAQDEYDKNTKEVAGHTEKNFGTMGTAINDTKTASENLKDQIVNDLVPELDTTLKNAIKNATDAWLIYIDTLEEVIRLTDEAMEKNKNAKENEFKEAESSENKDSKDTEGSESDQTPPDIEELSKTPELSKGSEVTVKSSVTHFSSKSDNKKMMKGVAGNKFYVATIDGDQVRLKDPHGPNYSASGITGWVKKTDLVGFATGGYTGEWGPEGKLAMLHQKELVLNAQDTENFLLGIQMLRSISEVLDRNAKLMGVGLSNMSAFTLHNSADNTLQQEVTIHAEFPNVNDHNEIEIAINNLVNQASQYAHKF